MREAMRLTNGHNERVVSIAKGGFTLWNTKNFKDLSDSLFL